LIAGNDIFQEEDMLKEGKRFTISLLGLMLAALLCSCNRVSKIETNETAEVAETVVHQTGDLFWELENDTLIISGNGEMPDYDTAPWDADKLSIIKVILDEGVTTIGDNAFKGCANLLSVDTLTIENGEEKNLENSINVEYLGNSAFEKCKSLKKINFLSAMNIGNYAFAECEELENVSVSELGGKNIGKSAFENCKKLTSIALPYNITIIDGSTFAGCESLEQIIIRRTVETIGSYAFANCSKLEKITCMGSVPPKIENNTFENIPKTAQIYILGNAVSAYRNTVFWNTFSFNAISEEEMFEEIFIEMIMETMH
jgi:hypothetical protein